MRVVVLAALLLLAGSTVAQNEEECIKRGFVPAQCTAANCDKLATFLKSPSDRACSFSRCPCDHTWHLLCLSHAHTAELVKECKECCIIGAGGGDEGKFDEAELTVCPMRYERLPEVQQFVNNVVPKFPSITVKVCAGLELCCCAPITRMPRGQSLACRLLLTAGWLHPCSTFPATTLC